jgi:hypothetical protein
LLEEPPFAFARELVDGGRQRLVLELFQALRE